MSEFLRILVQHIATQSTKTLILQFVHKLETHAVRSALASASKFWVEEQTKTSIHIRVRKFVYLMNVQNNVPHVAIEKTNNDLVQNLNGASRPNWLQGFQNPNWKEIHSVTKCERTSEFLGKNLIDKYGENKNRDGLLGIKALELREGVYHVTVPGKIIVPPIGYYDTDYTAICKHTLEAEQATGEISISHFWVRL